MRGRRHIAIARHGAQTIARYCVAAALALIAGGGCMTPQQHLLFSLLPDGTIPMLLSHLERVEDSNRKKIAEFEKRNDWDGLAKFAEENIQLDKANAHWWIIAGYAYSKAGQRERSVRSFSEAVRMSPDDMVGWNLLIEEYRTMGQPDRALQIANRALNVRTDVPETWYLTGETYSDLRRYEPASNAYGTALKLDENHTRAWLGLGKVYARLGRTAELKQVTDTLQKLDPERARELAAFQPK